MREILFRGKRLRGGEWVYGDLVHWNGDPNRPCIESEHSEQFGQHYRKVYEVDPATVGQFTGLTDKNGTKIFEGDVLAYGTNSAFKGVVEYDSEKGCYRCANGMLYEIAFKSEIINS